MLDRARANEKIEFLTNAVIDEILGDGKVDGVRLRDTQTDETWELPVDGVFVAIGHDPNTKLFVDQLDHDETGYLRHDAGHDARRTSTASSPPATSRTTPTARRSLRQGPAVWPHSTQSGCSRSEEGHEDERGDDAAPRSQRRSRPPRVESRPMAAKWIDLLDPTADELRAQCPRELEESAVELLLEAPEHEDEPRPTLRGHGDYVFGVFLLAQARPGRGRRSTTSRSGS